LRHASRFNKSNFGVANSKGGGKSAVAASNVPKWKIQSMQFQNGIRAARGQKPKGVNGGAISAQEAAQYEEPDDRVPCRHCGRKFNSVAAERHIPHCAKKAKDAAMRMGPARMQGI